MSVSLYYTAKREQPIILQEQNRCNEIADRYDQQYPFGDLYEGFCIYNLDKDRKGYEDDVILDGSTKLPTDVEGELYLKIVDWWLKCLEELVDVLPGAEWNVHLDDMDFEWSEEEHSFIPNI